MYIQCTCTAYIYYTTYYTCYAGEIPRGTRGFKLTKCHSNYTIATVTQFQILQANHDRSHFPIHTIWSSWLLGEYNVKSDDLVKTSKEFGCIIILTSFWNV